MGVFNIAIFERGETYTNWTTIRDRSDVKIDPASVKIYIYDPYDVVLVNNQNMTKSAVGIYYYNYDTISNTAPYGKYKVKVVATSGVATINTYITYFYVMPEKFEESIRLKMGITEDDIDDNALSLLAWTSYQEALHDVYVPCYNQQPKGNPATGAGFDGVNTSFQTLCYPIADIGGDGVVGDDSDAEKDISCFWIDSNGHRNEGYVNITNIANGEITITQLDTITAIPANNEGVYITYHAEHENYNSFLFHEAVAYLACHYVNIRLTERNKVTIADLNADKSIVMLNPNRYMKEYKRLIGLVYKPRILGVR